MTITLAFDVYGTLIDTHGVKVSLAEMMGDKADLFSTLWREKQLEYSFRRGLMQNYQDFAVCTRDALEYCCLQLGEDLSAEQKQRLLQEYRKLPAFSDVEPCLKQLQQGDYRMFAFSNGHADAVTGLLQHAGIDQYFAGVVSVDEIKSFKPNPAVYAHFLRRSGASGAQAWLISSNPFDVIGAVSAGMSSAWVQRSPQAVFDPWGIEPTITLTSLTDLDSGISGNTP
ncbi:MAG: haloacid dehalogenase type II [Gammaproteobacteria bacterium]|nr:haloacid dehalogenase type II [Gammaproteobacteria bacterium]